jgi:hypothetical protein
MPRKCQRIVAKSKKCGDAIRLHAAPASGENLRRLSHCIFPETQGRWNAFCMKCRPETPEKPDKKIIIV